MNSFTELNLSAPILRAITDMGYAVPSPIQAQTIPLLMSGNTDFIGLAATGTGKTAAFSIPMLEKLDPARQSVQALILCPTRELALQVTGQVNLLGRHLGISAVPIYGGSSYRDQFEGLESGSQVVVGTPGRIVDHIERGSLKLNGIKVLILDEADEMISMGFKEDLETVLKATPKEQSNIWLFSATMSPEIRKVADSYLTSPQQVQVNRTEMVPSTVEQIFYMVKESDKAEILCKIIDAADDFYGLIFCQTKNLVTDLTQYLVNRGYRVDSLHGDKDQNARERTMRAFRDRKIRILVCTDVASRGIDVKDITHVINYSLPRELDNYVHRIGRTARSGKTGVAISLVTPSHFPLVNRIERLTKTRLERGRIPTHKDVAVKKLSRLRERFQDQPQHAKATHLMDEQWLELLKNMTAEEVASRFISLIQPEILTPPANEYRQRDDSQRDYRSERPRRDDRPYRSDGPRRPERTLRDEYKKTKKAAVRREDDFNPADLSSWESEDFTSEEKPKRTPRANEGPSSRTGGYEKAPKKHGASYGKGPKRDYGYAKDSKREGAFVKRRKYDDADESAQPRPKRTFAKKGPKRDYGFDGGFERPRRKAEGEHKKAHAGGWSKKDKPAKKRSQTHAH